MHSLHSTSVLEQRHEVLELDEPQGDILGALTAILFVGLAIGAALVAGLGYEFFSSPDPIVSRALAVEVHERACIEQYAPGERHLKKKPVCALGTRDVPATALSYPLARQQ